MRSSLLTFDLGTTQVAGARFRRPGPALQLEAFGMEPFASEASSEASWLECVVPALADLVQRERWSGPCVVALPGQFTLTKAIAVPPGTAPASSQSNDASAAIAQLVTEHVPLPMDQIGWSLAPRQGGEALLTIVKLAVIRQLLAALTSLGLEVERVVPAPVALHDGFCRLHPEREPAVAVVHDGGRMAQVIFLAGASRTFRAVRPGPTADTGSAADLSYPEFDGPICRSIATYSSPSAPVGLARVYLSGRSAKQAALAAKLAEELNLPITRCAWGNSVSCAEDTRRKIEQSADPLALALIGLTCSAATSLLGESDLLPPAEATRRRTHARLRRFAAVVAVLAALLVLPTTYYQRRAAKSTAEQNLHTRKIAAWRQQHARIDRLEAEANVLDQRIALLEKARETNSAWLDFFARLQSQIAATEYVWLDRFVVERSRPDPLKTANPPADRRTRESAVSGSARDRVVEAEREIRLSGRILDVTAPTASRATSAAYVRGQELLTRLRALPMVAAIEHEQFATGSDALLRIEVTLRLRGVSFL